MPKSQEKAQEAATATNGKTAKQTKPPLPNGYETPVQFARRHELAPQVVYGFIRNSKDFPFEKDVAERNFVIKSSDGDKWMETRAQRKQEREAKAAEKAKAGASSE